MKNVSEYICHKNNRNAEKERYLWLRESGKIEEEGYREIFERIGTVVLWGPGSGSKIFIWKETKRIANIMNRLKCTVQRVVPPF